MAKKGKHTNFATSRSKSYKTIGRYSHCSDAIMKLRLASLAGLSFGLAVDAADPVHVLIWDDPDQGLADGNLEWADARLFRVQEKSQ
jgi:hypothetical protein